MDITPFKKHFILNSQNFQIGLNRQHLPPTIKKYNFFIVENFQKKYSIYGKLTRLSTLVSPFPLQFNVVVAFTNNPKNKIPNNIQ